MGAMHSKAAPIMRTGSFTGFSSMCLPARAAGPRSAVEAPAFRFRYGGSILMVIRTNRGANPYRNPIVAEQGIRIGTLARQLGTTTKTLRFYEQIGLLGPAQRSQSAYRLYDSEAVATARLVLGLRHLDLSIAELQDMLRDDGKTTRRRRLMALMDERLRRMELELSVIQGRCDDLSARHAALLATPRERPPHCVCEALLQSCLCLKKALKAA